MGHTCKLSKTYNFLLVRQSFIEPRIFAKYKEATQQGHCFMPPWSSSIQYKKDLCLHGTLTFRERSNPFLPVYVRAERNYYHSCKVKYIFYIFLFGTYLKWNSIIFSFVNILAHEVLGYLQLLSFMQSEICILYNFTR